MTCTYTSIRSSTNGRLLLSIPTLDVQPVRSGLGSPVAWMMRDGRFPSQRRSVGLLDTKQPTRAVTFCRIWEAQPKGALQWLAELDDALVAGIILPIRAKKTAEGRRAHMIEPAVYRLVMAHGLFVLAGCVTRGPGSLPRVRLRLKCTGLSSSCILARWAYLPVLVARSMQLSVKLRVCISKLDFSTTPNRPAPSRFGETRLQISTRSWLLEIRRQATVTMSLISESAAV